MAVGANQPVVSASEFQEAMRRIKQLEGALGRKTLEKENLKESVNFVKVSLQSHHYQQCLGGFVIDDVQTPSAAKW